MTFPVSNRLMTPRECAEFLGVSVSTVMRWVSRREIPHVRPSGEGHGKPVRFDGADVQRWLESKKVQPE